MIIKARIVDLVAVSAYAEAAYAVACDPTVSQWDVIEVKLWSPALLTSLLEMETWDGGWMGWDIRPTDTLFDVLDDGRMWMYSVQGDGGVTIMEAWNKIGSPILFHVFAGNGSMRCRVVDRLQEAR